MRVVTQGKAGLGFFPALHVNLGRGKEKNSLVQEEVRATVEEIRS